MGGANLSKYFSLQPHAQEWVTTEVVKKHVALFKASSFTLGTCIGSAVTAPCTLLSGLLHDKEGGARATKGVLEAAVRQILGGVLRVEECEESRAGDLAAGQWRKWCPQPAWDRTATTSTSSHCSATQPFPACSFLLKNTTTAPCAEASTLRKHFL